jgi:sigma-E factor negative regulatory protein RseA
MRAGMKQGLDATDGDGCREKLSSLIDGELDAAECAAMVERICADPQVRSQWALMHAAGDAMRSSEVAALHSGTFAARVSAALASEPTVLAPVLSARRRYQRVLVPGLAVAAAGALLIVVAVPQLRGSVETTQIAVTPVVTPAPSATQQIEVARVPEIERYLRAHRELTGATVMPGATPYLRTSNNLPVEAR